MNIRNIWNKYKELDSTDKVFYPIFAFLIALMAPVMVWLVIAMFSLIINGVDTTPRLNRCVAILQELEAHEPKELCNIILYSDVKSNSGNGGVIGGVINSARPR